MSVSVSTELLQTQTRDTDTDTDTRITGMSGENRNSTAIAAFTAAAERYHQLRPSYTAATCLQVLTAAHLLTTSGTTSNNVVLELGPGTGILTRLLAHPWETSLSDRELLAKEVKRGKLSDEEVEANPIVVVPQERRPGPELTVPLVITSGSTPLPEVASRWIAVDPSDGMLAVFNREIVGTNTKPAFETVLGSADDLANIADSTVDAVIGGQCAHWFATEAATKEIIRVLKPGGALVLVWNTDDTRCKWTSAVKDLTNQYDTNVPQYRNGGWFEGIFCNESARAGFDLPIFHSRWDNPVVTGGFDSAMDNLFTKSYIQSLPDATKATFRSQIAEVKSKFKNEIQQQTKEDGTLIYPYVTDVYWTYKK